MANNSPGIYSRRIRGGCWYHRRDAFFWRIAYIAIRIWMRRCFDTQFPINLLSVHCNTIRSRRDWLFVGGISEQALLTSALRMSSFERRSVSGCPVDRIQPQLQVAWMSTKPIFWSNAYPTGQKIKFLVYSWCYNCKVYLSSCDWAEATCLNSRKELLRDLELGAQISLPFWTTP